MLHLSETVFLDFRFELRIHIGTRKKTTWFINKDFNFILKSFLVAPASVSWKCSFKFKQQWKSSHTELKLENTQNKMAGKSPEGDPECKMEKMEKLEPFNWYSNRTKNSHLCSVSSWQNEAGIEGGSGHMSPGRWAAKWWFTVRINRITLVQGHIAWWSYFASFLEAPAPLEVMLVTHWLTPPPLLMWLWRVKIQRTKVLIFFFVDVWEKLDGACIKVRISMKLHNRENIATGETSQAITSLTILTCHFSNFYEKITIILLDKFYHKITFITR